MLLLDGAEGTRKIGAQAAADGLLNIEMKKELSPLVDNNKVYSFPKEAGWYQIAELNISTVDDISSRSSCPEFIFLKNWHEVHKILLCTFANNKARFHSILDRSMSFPVLSEIRIRNSVRNNYNYAVLEIYKIPTSDTSTWNIIINDRSLSYGSCWQFIDLVPANETDTTIIEHTFKANSWLDGPDGWPLT